MIVQFFKFSTMLELFEYNFFTNAFIASILIGIICGIIGSFVVIKKMSFISGGIAHASFGGIGIAYFLGMNPLLGALIFAILSALGIGIINRKNKLQEDASIGTVWAIGMAIGLLFIHLTPGYSADLFSYLFGNILLTSNVELVWIFLLCALVVGCSLVMFKWLFAFILDEEFLLASGVRTFPIYLFLLIITAISIIALIKVVGAILVIALLSLPSATMQLFSKRFSSIIFGSIVLAITFNLAGLFLSYYYNLPTGPVIILSAGIIYFFSWLLTRRRHFPKYT